MPVGVLANIFIATKLWFQLKRTTSQHLCILIEGVWGQADMPIFCGRISPFFIQSHISEGRRQKSLSVANSNQV
jgi:hypothetical protein